MRVDEAGRGGPAVQVDYLSPAANSGAHGGIRSDRNDLPAGDRHSLYDRIVGVDGEHLAVLKHDLGGALSGRGQHGTRSGKPRDHNERGGNDQQSAHGASVRLQQSPDARCPAPAVAANVRTLLTTSRPVNAANEFSFTAERGV